MFVLNIYRHIQVILRIILDVVQIKLIIKDHNDVSLICKLCCCTCTVCPPGGNGVVWSKLQDVLSSVEDSISFKRSWAAPITAVDLNKHKEHLRAAQESSAKATQVSVTKYKTSYKGCNRR